MQISKVSVEFRKRKAAVVKSLFELGESAIARDFEEATEKASFETVEHAMRIMLKSRGADNPHWASTIASAIYEAQTLPHLDQATMKPKAVLLEMLIIELAIIAIKSSEVSPGERQRINHILGDLQVAQAERGEK